MEILLFQFDAFLLGGFLKAQQSSCRQCFPCKHRMWVPFYMCLSQVESVWGGVRTRIWRSSGKDKQERFKLGDVLECGKTSGTVSLVI